MSQSSQNPAPGTVVTTTVGVETPIATTPLLTASHFRHHDDQPCPEAEERFGPATLIFTTSGQWTFHAHTGSHRIGPHRLVAAAAGTAYAVTHDQDLPTDQNVAVEIDDTALRRFVDDHPDPIAQQLAEAAISTCSPVRPVGRVESALLEILVTPSANQPDRALLLDAITLGLLADLHELDGHIGRVTVGTRQRELAEEAKRYLEGHFMDGPGLTTLAHAVNASTAHVARVFRAVIGMTPYAYAQSLRIAEARRRLRETHQPISQVAADLGYATPSHFAQAFRRATGMTPRAFRNRR